MKLRIVRHNVCYFMSRVNFTCKPLHKMHISYLAELMLSILYFLLSLDDILCLTNGVSSVIGLTSSISSKVTTSVTDLIDEMNLP